MARWRRLLPLLIFAVVGFFLWRGLYNDPHRLPSTLTNKPIPAFSLQDLSSPSRVLNEQLFKRQVTVLNVFASWCMYCLAEHSSMMDMVRDHQVNLVGLNYKDHRIKAQRWLKRYGNPFKTVIYDPKGHLAVDLGVYGTPETFLVDGKGIIRYKHVGPVSAGLWRRELLPRIKQLQREL